MNRNLRLQNPKCKCYSRILVQFNFSFTHPVGWWKQFLWGSLILVFQVCAYVPNSSKTLGGRGRGEKDTTRTLYKLGEGAASGKTASFSSIFSHCCQLQGRANMAWQAGRGLSSSLGSAQRALGAGSPRGSGASTPHTAPCIYLLSGVSKTVKRGGSLRESSGALLP